MYHNLPTRVGRENSSTCSEETYLRGAGQKVGSIDYYVCLFMALISVFSSWESLMLTYFLIRRWLASHSMTTQRTQTRQKRGNTSRSQHIPKNYIHIIPSKITNQGKREKILPGFNTFVLQHICNIFVHFQFEMCELCKMRYVDNSKNTTTTSDNLNIKMKMNFLV